MKYVTKFLCAFAITAFISSCASSASGCYDFGYKTDPNIDTTVESIAVINVGTKSTIIDHDPTNCLE